MNPMMNVAFNTGGPDDRVFLYIDGHRTILARGEMVDFQYPPSSFVIDYVHQQFQYPAHQPAILRFRDISLGPQPRGILAAWIAYIGQAVGTLRTSRFLARETELGSSALHNAKSAISKVINLPALGLTLEPADADLSGDNTPYILRSAGRSCVVIVPQRDFQIDPMRRPTN